MAGNRLALKNVGPLKYAAHATKPARLPRQPSKHALHNQACKCAYLLAPRRCCYACTPAVAAAAASVRLRLVPACCSAALETTAMAAAASFQLLLQQAPCQANAANVTQRHSQHTTQGQRTHVTEPATTKKSTVASIRLSFHGNHRSQSLQDTSTCHGITTGKTGSMLTCRMPATVSDKHMTGIQLAQAKCS